MSIFAGVPRRVQSWLKTALWAAVFACWFLAFPAYAADGPVIGTEPVLHVVSFEFDESGRIARKLWSNGVTLIYQWDNESIEDVAAAPDDLVGIEDFRFLDGVRVVRLGPDGRFLSVTAYGQNVRESPDQLDASRPIAHYDAKKGVLFRYENGGWRVEEYLPR